MKKIYLSLIALLILSTFFINCGGGSGGSSSPGGEKPGVPEIVQVLPSHYVAITNSAILIRAKILNGNGGPVKNLPVTFTNISPIGTLMSYNDVLLGNQTVVKTDDSGMATIKVKSTTTGFVTVQAEVNKGVGMVRDRKTMYFGSSLALSPFMYLDVNGDADTTYNEPTDYTLFENDNDNKVVVRATVFSKFGQRAAGVSVQFGADSTEASFPNGNTAITNSDGEAFTLVQVDPAIIRDLETFINITASASNGAANIYTLYLMPVTIDSVTVNANPSVLAPNATSAISAAVKLNTGGPSPDSSAVSFVADCGTVTPFAQTISGLATATFTAPSTVPAPPVCRVTATIAGVSNYADISISAAGILIIPGSQSIVAPGTATYTVSGGTPPYVITSTDPSSACNSTTADCVGATGIWNLADAGPFTVTVPSNAVAGNIALNVFDSLGATKSATLTIISGGAAAGITINPASISVTGLAGATDNVTFTITGGTSPYTVFTTNTAVAEVVSTTATAFTVDPKVVAASTAVTLTVVDSLGLNKTATITVTPLSSSLGVNPSTLAVAIGTLNIQFNIIGGFPPYDIYTSDSSKLSLVGGPNVIYDQAATSFTADAVGNGTATLTIVDNDGKTVTSNVTVTPGSGAPPVVIATTPAASAINVPVNSDISVQFDQAMSSASITGGSFLVFDNTAVTPFLSPCIPDVTYISASHTARFNIGACGGALPNNHNFTVTLTTAITSETGFPLAAPYVFSFTTVP